MTPFRNSSAVRSLRKSSPSRLLRNVSAVKSPHDPGTQSRKWPALMCLAVFSLTACDQVDQIRNELREQTPHEAYLESLRAVNLTETALGTQWERAAVRSLSEAPTIELPFEEEGFLFDETPEARSYRFELRRGQRLSIDADLEGGDSFRFFIDLYRVPEDASNSPLPVLSSEFASGPLEYVSSRRADYVVRLQPELLGEGRYRVALHVEGSLSFPVAERDTRAILSFFNDPRDGGSRDHRGVDIFAPRGTPVLSASKGSVYRVRTTPVGGNVVWVRAPDSRDRYYYAHLDSQVVRNGEEVEPGTLLGFVGNTGNARTTPPHLHFGVYSRGAQDPWDYLFQPSRTPPNLTAPLEHLGDWTRTVDAGIRLREGPSTGAEVVTELEESTPLRVLAALGSWYRVRLPDGRYGFVAARLTEAVAEPTAKPVRRESVGVGQCSQPGRAGDGGGGGRNGGRRVGPLRRVSLRAVRGRKHGLDGWSGRPLEALGSGPLFPTTSTSRHVRNQSCIHPGRAPRRIS